MSSERGPRGQAPAVTAVHTTAPRTKPAAVRWAIGGATVIKGEFLDSAPNSTRNGDTLFGYTDITWTF